MLLLTLLALEGMARIAYYAAYGQGYGGSPPAAAVNLPAPLTDPEPFEPWLISHPFYGFTDQGPYHSQNAMPPRRRRADTVVVALLGGSVAEQIEPFLQNALNRWFAANHPNRRPIVLGLANRGAKQPQQTLIVANTLLLGGEFDLIVNLDGFNEITASVTPGNLRGILPGFPFFPKWWNRRVGLTAADIALAGRIGVLRREQARLTQSGETAALRRSALFGLVNRYRRERTAGEIIQLNHELAAADSTYNLERHGPRSWLVSERELRQAAAGLWYRSSAVLAGLAELAGAEYYHFVQPNQYVPDAKPLSPQEREMAYDPQEALLPLVAQGYPLLTEFGPDLPKGGVNYFDLTGIFADNPETLYGDTCCHFNERGNELLAAAMAQRLEPALLSLVAESPVGPVSPLAAGRRPVAPSAAPDTLEFQVYLGDERKSLGFVREGCDPEDTEPRFFVDITPQDLADLPPQRLARGFDNLDFSFAEAGGVLTQGQCTVQVPLPDYPIAYIATGQYVPVAGQIWNKGFPFPE